MQDGTLHSGFYPFIDLISALRCEVVLLTEPHLPPQARLPTDQPFSLVSNPHPQGCFQNRRDAAILGGQASQQSGMQRIDLSNRRDIVACLCHHGSHVQDTLFISAYVPDTSRGHAARSDFWQCLTNVLQLASARYHAADIVLGLDSNTWLSELDPSRDDSADAEVLRQILHVFGLQLWSTPGEATHNSGTVIDIVAASAGVRVTSFQVHNLSCIGTCRHYPTCYPVLGSDHHLITFTIDKDVDSPRPSAPSWQLRAIDWSAALRGDPDGLSAWTHMLEEAQNVTTEGRQLALDVLNWKLVSWLWDRAIACGGVHYSTTHPGRSFRRRRWWNAACKALWTRRQEAFIAWRQNPAPSLHAAYKEARNAFAHEVRRVRRASWRSFAEDLLGTASHDPRRAARVVSRESAASTRSAPPSMQDPATGAALSPSASLNGWASHFAAVGRQESPDFDQHFLRRLQRRLRRLRANVVPGTGDMDYPFTEPELLQARQAVSTSTAPGLDGLPYACFSVDWQPWNQALLGLFNLCLSWGLVPSGWKQGLVVPLPKGGDPSSYSNWRPITLLACLGKLFERLMLPRLVQKLCPQLADCQAGFRFGADEQAWLLFETLRLRQRLPRPLRKTFLAFVDVRKAYDTVWRDGLLHKLWQRGIRGSMWALCGAFLTRTSARARVNGCFTQSWDEENGVRQGAILSPLEFIVFLDDLYDALIAAYPGVLLGTDRDAPRLHVLFYADDIAIFAESESDMHAALAALQSWASKWRLRFSIGPEKSAVMELFPNTASGQSPFVLDGQQMPWVTEYRYLGVLIDNRLSLCGHIRHLRSRAHAKFWQLCGWARREGLPLHVLHKIVHAYVMPACLFGSELLCASPQRCADITRLQREIGRYLLCSAHAPNTVVQGDLAWASWDFVALERAANLLSRLAAAPASRLAVRVFEYARHVPTSWCSKICCWLRQIGICLPWAYGIGSGCPPSHRRAYLHRAVRPALAAADCVRWRSALCSAVDPALQRYARSAANPTLPFAHSWRVQPAHAFAWGRVRSGSSVVGADRIARHLRGHSRCALCNNERGDLAHLLQFCPSLAVARARWWDNTFGAFPGQALVDVPAQDVVDFFCCPSHATLPWVIACARYAYDIELAHDR